MKGSLLSILGLLEGEHNGLHAKRNNIVSCGVRKTLKSIDSCIVIMVSCIMQLHMRFHVPVHAYIVCVYLLCSVQLVVCSSDCSKCMQRYR